jgi:Protein of unknown function (DUF4229)
VHGHPTLVYTTWRIVLFLGTLGGAYLVGLRGLLLVIVAVLGSGLISLFVLTKQRDAMSAAVTERVRRVKDRIDSSAAAEDVEDGEDRSDGGSGQADKNRS